jgi:hypothetical protein
LPAPAPQNAGAAGLSKNWKLVLSVTFSRHKAGLIGDIGQDASARLTGAGKRSEDEMAEIIALDGKGTQRKRRRPTLTTAEMFRLWTAAVKDDDKLADQILRKVYDDMMAADPQRAEDVIELTIRRSPAAAYAFAEFFRDMRED